MRLQDLFETRSAVAEGAPELLKAEMPLVRHIEKELTQHGYEKGTAEYNEHFKHALAYYRKFGNVDAIKQGVAEGLPQTLRKFVPGYARREIDKKMDAEKFGKTDVDRDANFQRYKKIQDKLKEQGVAEGEGSKSNPYEQGGTDAWYHRGFDPEAHGYQPGTEEYREYKRGYDYNDFGPDGGKQY
jgi:hypothetical protein